MLEKIASLFHYFKAAVPFRLVPALIATAVLFGLLLMPVPEGLTPKGWQLVAIFLTTIVAIILKVMPIGVMALMAIRSEEHTSELQSQSNIVCRLLLEKKKHNQQIHPSLSLGI